MTTLHAKREKMEMGDPFRREIVALIVIVLDAVFTSVAAIGFQASQAALSVLAIVE